jgi:PEP-CTERM motif
VSVNLSFPQFTLSSFVPKTSMGVLDLHRKLTLGGPQAITATPGMGGGAPGIPGTVVAKTAMHIAAGPSASMFNVGANTLLRVPLDIGHAGQLTGTFSILGQSGLFTVDHFAWTPGTLVFSDLTSKGQSSPPVTVMGSFVLSAQGGGTVTLVSPTKFKAVCALLTTNRIESLSTLKLTFVPEPGTLLLITAAGAALAGWWRRG